MPWTEYPPGNTPYVEYARMDTLLDLQRPRTGLTTEYEFIILSQVKFLLGNKNPAMVRPHGKSPQFQQVLDQLRGPSIYDEALGVLHRRGLGVPRDVLDRDLTQPYRSSEAVEAAWRGVYRSPDEHRDLHQLAEAMIEVAYLFGRWRSTHLLTVQRLLGDKPGTGGTSGVAWLRSINEHRFFPELWSVRSSL